MGTSPHLSRADGRGRAPLEVTHHRCRPGPVARPSRRAVSPSPPPKCLPPRPRIIRLVWNRTFRGPGPHATP